MPLAAGVAVVDAVAAVTGVEAGLKWPNDVLVEDRKLAGILAEVAPSETAIVVGVGLNVTLSPEEAGDVDVWRAVGGAGGGLSEDYRARSLTIGNPVRATLPGGREIVGTARSIDEQGRLYIEAGGQTTAVSAGDVVNLRPSP